VELFKKNECHSDPFGKIQPEPHQDQGNPAEGVSRQTLQKESGNQLIVVLKKNGFLRHKSAASDFSHPFEMTDKVK